MIRVTDTISIGDDELEERFVLASGPGGQNVNKVASAVQLRFDAVNSPSLPDPVRARILKLAGARASKAGVITIVARRHRTQERNRAEAREKLLDLIRRAATPPKRRLKTRVPTGERTKRLEKKRQRSTVKRARLRPADE